MLWVTASFRQTSRPSPSLKAARYSILIFLRDANGTKPRFGKAVVAVDSVRNHRAQQKPFSGRLHRGRTVHRRPPRFSWMRRKALPGPMPTISVLLFSHVLTSGTILWDQYNRQRSTISLRFDFDRTTYELIPDQKWRTHGLSTRDAPRFYRASLSLHGDTRTLHSPRLRRLRTGEWPHLPPITSGHKYPTRRPIQGHERLQPAGAPMGRT